ncbi:MAG TPA: hypothetical protein VGG15_01305 [Terriglobales bacterium]
MLKKSLGKLGVSGSKHFLDGMFNVIFYVQMRAVNHSYGGRYEFLLRCTFLETSGRLLRLKIGAAEILRFAIPARSE